MSNFATTAPQNTRRKDRATSEEANQQAARAKSGRFRGYFASCSLLIRGLLATVGTALITVSVLMMTEWLMRGTAASWLQFFSLSNMALWTTLVLVFLTLTLLDGLLGRLWQAVLIVAPVLLGPGDMPGADQGQQIGFGDVRAAPQLHAGQDEDQVKRQHEIDH